MIQLASYIFHNVFFNHREDTFTKTHIISQHHVTLFKLEERLWESPRIQHMHPDKFSEVLKRVFLQRKCGQITVKKAQVQIIKEMMLQFQGSYTVHADSLSRCNVDS